MTTENIRKVLNALFLIGALISVILYITLDNKTPFFYVCSGALFVKIMEFFIRFTR